MSRGAGFFMGSALCEVTGARPEKFLNALGSAGIAYSRVSSVDDFTLRLVIEARDMAAAKSLATRSQCEIRRVKERGVSSAARRLRRRTALVAAGVVCFALLAASSLFVWDIDVEGNETVSTGEILRALASCGVESGSFWPGWEADSIENSVILAVPELSWVGVSVDGSRAYVRVRERIEMPEIVDNDAPGSISAAATGIIERMEVLAGEPLVAAGDAVAAGETLVSGEIPSEVGDTLYVHAQARIIARTWRELTAAAPIEYTAAQESGSHTRWAVIVGGRRFNFYAGSSQTPLGCGKITTEYPLAWDGVFTLPVTLVREQIVEYDAAPAGGDTEALTSRLSEVLSAELTQLLDGRGEVLNTTFTASESGGMLYVTMRAECTEDIAVYTPAEGF